MTDDSTRKRKYLGIQVLRGLAALMVVYTHSSYYVSERLAPDFYVWLRGTRGVDIFFVISGFVMMYTSQKLFQRADGWKVFAKHRILRIVPLYWLVTTVKVVALLAAASLVLHTRLTWTTVLCSYFFLPSHNLDGKLEPLVIVGWTLNFEMMFYALFALALFLKKNVFLFLGIALGLLTLGSFLRQPSWPAPSFYLNTITIEFYFGMLIAHWCRRGFLLPQRLAAVLLPIGVLMMLLPSMTWEDHVQGFLIGIPAALIVWCVVSLETWERHLPRVLLFLGDASYSIYLIHPFVCPAIPAIMHRLHWNHPVVAVVLSVPFGAGAGCLLYRFVESPINEALRRRFLAEPVSKKAHA